jgi:Cdc6-like AAA superfamily ATPase
MRQNQNDAQHYRIMAWLSPSDYPAQQSDIISRRQEGTGQWFLDAPEVARWLSEPKKTLFCPGIPGAGKTMIAAIAIDYLLREVQSSTIGVAYMYCNYKAQKEQDVPSLLAAFLKQLVQAQPSTAEPVEQLHRKHADRGTKPSVEEILEALKTVVSNYTTVHVVVDALDECADSNGTRGQFLLQLRNLQAMTDLRLMTTSRLIPDVVEEFREAIILDVRARDQDVRRFVAGHIYRLPKCVQRDSSLQDMVQDKVAKSVDGM